MLGICLAVCLQILEFGHLDEWLGVLYTNREHFQTLSPTLFAWIKKRTLHSLYTIFNAIPFDKAAFFEHVRQCNAQVTGSIIMQALLGNDVFHAKDIDVFMLMQGPRVDGADFDTPLHKYLFECATGIKVTPGQAFTLLEKQHIDQHVRCLTTEFVHEEKNSGYTTMVMNLLREVWQYQIGTHQIQIITVGPAIGEEELKQIPNSPYVRRFRDGMNCETIQNYITQCFDIRMATSFYDGKILCLNHITDLFDRCLVLQSYFFHRMQHCDAGDLEIYNKRLAKYFARGFHLHPKSKAALKELCRQKNFKRANDNDQEDEEEEHDFRFLKRNKNN